ncbi:hypothetical protein ACIG5E_19705 [Kitasatospora sp. NPDC053057]|uniref:hypothetical protein n=1 Tax=Kitasatospora sp. NPDC053057 TaxID=3364062 RepID=UPI0037C93CCF
MGAALLTLVYALIEGPSRGWTDPRVIGCAVAVVLLVAFLLLELRLAESMLELRLFRDDTLSGALLSGFVVSFGMFGALFFLPLSMQGVLGWSPSGSAYGGLPMTAMLVVAGPLSGRLAARYGPRPPMVFGLAIGPIADAPTGAAHGGGGAAGALPAPRSSRDRAATAPGRRLD